MLTEFEEIIEVVLDSSYNNIIRKYTERSKELALYNIC